MGSKNKNPNKKKLEKGTDDTNHGSTKVITDPRFESMHSDPRFQNLPKHKSKVVIDSRFDRMFSDKNFASASAPLDKRGKPKKQSSESHLRHYYRLEDEENKGISRDDEEDDEGSDESENEIKKMASKPLDESEESESDGEPLSDVSDSSLVDTTDEEDADFSEDEVEIQVENVPEIDKETHRLAIVNMDWSEVQAADLYVVLSSFLPKDGQILSVAVYPSEFGLKRMKEEELHGPVSLFEDDKNKAENDDDNDEIDDVKLRAYEQSKQRYYYAVVDCDSIATANFIYKACDGVEFERSSNVLDLRFIPDDMEFKHPPRDIAKERPASYEGLDFHTRALQQSNIHLSWDDDEPHRAKKLKRKFNAEQLADLEVKEFLASDESDTDDDDENENAVEEKKNKKRDKYRSLIESGDGSDDEVDGEKSGQDMEITFNTGLEDLSKRILENQDKKTETVWEAYLRRRKEKKNSRKIRSKNSSDDESDDNNDEEAIGEADDFFVEEPKRSQKSEAKSQKDDKEVAASAAELELLLADDKGEAASGPKGYNLKAKKSKGKKRKQVLSEAKIPTLEENDSRFSAVFTSPLFALDPTDPQFKRSATYVRQLAQKQQKANEVIVVEKAHKLPRQAQSPSDEFEVEKDETSKPDSLLSSKKEKHELSALVRSIKMRSKQVELPSNAKPSKKNKLESNGERKQENRELASLIQSVKKKAKVLQK